MRFVVTAYPDLIWEMTAPPMFRLDVRQVAYTWRGSGHCTGVLQPPGIPGTGNAFRLEGLEILSFRGEQVCALNAVYDLASLNRRPGVVKAARAAKSERSIE